MQCLKCGRETEGTNVFCKACLEQMSARPVRPGTPVTIYPRPEKKPSAPVKNQITPEEQIIKLKHRSRRMAVVITLLSVMLVLSATGLGWKLYQDLRKFPLGQNYSTVAPEATKIDPSDPTTAPTTAPTSSTAPS